MNEKQLLAKIEEVEKEIFYNLTIDIWDKEDFEFDKRKNEELEYLKQKLAELRGGKNGNK